MAARRTFMAAAAALAPGLVRAQGRGLPRRIGFLHSVALNPGGGAYAILRPLWAQAGFVEGESVLWRSAGGDPGRLPGLVADLLAQDVSLIIAVGAEALRAAFAGTRTVPIIGLDLETNPIATGMARSYARPGGNVTGLFLDQPTLAAKWIDLLREVAPGLDRLGLVWDPSTGRDQLAVAQAAATARGLAPLVIDWRAAGSMAAALAPLGGTPTGLVTLTAPGFLPTSHALGQAALALRLPAVTFLRLYLGSGILMSYGPNQQAHFSRAMAFVERILAGQAPGDLPIEFPRRFECVIDQRVARALDLALPPTLLAQADEVIE